MANLDFSVILNNHFILRHCIARDGNDTPTDFHCYRGMRKWSRFFYLDKGKVLFKNQSGDEIHMNPGDIMYLPYDIEYSSSWEDKENGHYFTTEFIIEDVNSNRLDLCDDIVLLFSDSGEYRKLFSEMAKTMSSGTVGFHLKCQEQFMHLLYLIAMRNRAENQSQWGIKRAISAIENNYREEIDTDSLAEMCHMSPATFRRRFTEFSGMPPVRYRNCLRLKKAKELISTGIYTVTEAAELVGIGDIFYFSRIYKREFGNAPSADMPK